MMRFALASFNPTNFRLTHYLLFGGGKCEGGADFWGERG